MEIVNIYEIETAYGFKAIELIHGNLLKIKNIDLLVISAFQDNYEPVEGSLIWHLETDLNLNLYDVVESATIDLRKNFNSWVSKTLTGFSFERIAGVEFDVWERNAEGFNKTILNFFSTLPMIEMQGVNISTIALPIIGTGSQGIAPADIMHFLIEHSQFALEKIPSLRRVRFVEIDEEKIKNFDKIMNIELGR